MMTRDMTRGRPFGLIATFALPLMVGSVFQQLYTIVDAAVVGQFVGVHALAAVGASDWINWMITSAIIGFTQGFCILTSQRFGAGDLPGLRRSVTAAARLTLLLSLALTIVGLLTVRPLLQLLQTPADTIDLSQQYLVVTILGILVIGGYNLFAAVLRALGNSRDPLIAMIIAALLNVVLDLWFVIGLGWGVAGAAAATVLGQLFSCLYCLWRVLRVPQLKMVREDWRRERATDRELLRLGAPLAFQNAIIAVGGLAVQYVVNGFGSVFMAGFTVTNKLYGLLEMAATSYGYSMATYCGQNLGARQFRRIRRGVKTATGLALATAVVISVIMVLLGRQILSLFISQEDPQMAAETLRVGYTYLMYMAALLPVLYLLHIYRSSLQGMGDTVVPMASGIAELIMRVLVAMTLPHLLGENGIYFAEITAWTSATILLVTAYFRRIHSLPREDAPLPQDGDVG